MEKSIKHGESREAKQAFFFDFGLEKRKKTKKIFLNLLRSNLFAYAKTNSKKS